MFLFIWLGYTRKGLPHLIHWIVGIGCPPVDFVQLARSTLPATMPLFYPGKRLLNDWIASYFAHHPADFLGSVVDYRYDSSAAANCQYHQGYAGGDPAHLADLCALAVSGIPRRIPNEVIVAVWLVLRPDGLGRWRRNRAFVPSKLRGLDTLHLSVQNLD
jgi:hypothetical protein